MLGCRYWSAMRWWRYCGYWKTTVVADGLLELGPARLEAAARRGWCWSSCYCLERLSQKGKRLMVFLLLFTMMLPWLMVELPWKGDKMIFGLVFCWCKWRWWKGSGKRLGSVIIEVEDERNGVVGLLWLLQEACFFFFFKERGLPFSCLVPPLYCRISRGMSASLLVWIFILLPLLSPSFASQQVLYPLTRLLKADRVRGFGCSLQCLSSDTPTGIMLGT